MHRQVGNWPFTGGADLPWRPGAPVCPHVWEHKMEEPQHLGAEPERCIRKKLTWEGLDEETKVLAGEGKQQKGGKKPRQDT